MKKEDFGFLGTQYMPEQEDFQDVLKKAGISYEERVIPTVGTFIAPMEEVHYRNKEGRERYVYILIPGGADYSGQTCYAFEQPVPGDQLADIIESLRREGQSPGRSNPPPRYFGDVVADFDD